MDIERVAKIKDEYPYGGKESFVYLPIIRVEHIIGKDEKQEQSTKLICIIETYGIV
jgi:hypothetical protein